MRYTEEIACFHCDDAQLIGLLARPDKPLTTGVVVVVGGPQYRVGSHRQFVLLARALAASGYPVMRFDYRGMGDSEGEPRDFEQTGADIDAAITCLQQQVPEVQQVALWGLCDGASAALLYCSDTPDARVTSLCLANPWVRSESSLARAQVRHYYTKRLLQPAFWRKLLRGGIRPSAMTSLVKALWRALRRPLQSPAAQQSSFQQRMARGWSRFSGRIFLLLSENDYTAKEFLDHLSHDSAWKGALHHPNLVRHQQAGADHTFSSAALRAQVAELTRRHGLELQPADKAPAPTPTSIPVPSSAFAKAQAVEAATGAARPAPHKALGPTT